MHEQRDWGFTTGFAFGIVLSGRHSTLVKGSSHIPRAHTQDCTSRVPSAVCTEVLRVPEPAAIADVVPSGNRRICPDEGPGVDDCRNADSGCVRGGSTAWLAVGPVDVTVL